MGETRATLQPSFNEPLAVVRLVVRVELAVGLIGSRLTAAAGWTLDFID